MWAGFRGMFGGQPARGCDPGAIDGLTKAGVFGKEYACFCLIGNFISYTTKAGVRFCSFWVYFVDNYVNNFQKKHMFH